MAAPLALIHGLEAVGELGDGVDGQIFQYPKHEKITRVGRESAGIPDGLANEQGSCSVDGVRARAKVQTRGAPAARTWRRGPAGGR